MSVRWLPAALLTALLLVAVWLAIRPSGPEARVRASLSLLETLGGADTAGFLRAEGERTFDFPADHGPHDGFRTEWWYLTGNLETDEGRRFGYQLTFFRQALAPGEQAGDGASAEGAEGVSRPGLRGEREETPRSRWATRHAWMAHFTLTDVRDGRFHAFERFEREALDLAGARGRPLRVWVGPWEIRSTGSGTDSSPFPLVLDAGTDSVRLHLTLEPGKGVVLQGDGGLSRKGPEPGNASWYYSMPRLATEGRVVTPDGTWSVRGTSWLDREWSTSALSEGVVGWDWFALRLDDGRDVMVYGLRREDGTFSPFSEGVVVEADGAPRRLRRDDFSIDVLERWASPSDGTDYPSRWRIRIPAEGLDLEVRPILGDQELRLAFRYWEGAVEVRAHPDAGPDAPALTGHGYVELTGYASADGPPR